MGVFSSDDFTTFQLRNYLEALEDRDPQVRKFGLHALKGTTDYRVLEQVTDRLADPIPEVRLAAAQTLQGVQHGYITKILVSKLKDTRWFVREAAALALKGVKELTPLLDLVDLLPDPVPSVSTAASFALRGTTDKKVLEVLCHQLRHQSSGVRFGAASALIGTKDEPTVARLVRILERAADPELREVAAYALKGNSWEGAIPIMLNALEDTSPRVRIRAAEALEGVSGDKIARHLLPLLDDVNPGVRRQTARALAGRVEYEVESEIIATLSSEPIASVREALVVALEGVLGAATVLRQVLSSDPDPLVREAAARVLGASSGAQFSDALLQCLPEEENEQVRWAIITAFSGKTDSRSRMVLTKIAMGDAPVSTREAAISALQGTTDPWVGAVCSKLLAAEYWQDKEVAIRRVCAEVLSGFSSGESVEALVHSLVHDSSEHVREVCARALKCIDDPRARLALRDVLDSPILAIRRTSVSSLDPNSGEDVVERLVEILQGDRDWGIRQLAAQRLSRCSHPLALKALRQAFHDNNSLVRNAAAEALQGTSDPVVLRGLLKDALGTNQEVRYLAATALRGTSQQEALSELSRALESKNPQLRVVAIHALQGTADPQAKAQIRKALRDSNAFVRTAAQQALMLF